MINYNKEAVTSLRLYTRKKKQKRKFLCPGDNKLFTHPLQIISHLRKLLAY